MKKIFISVVTLIISIAADGQKIYGVTNKIIGSLDLTVVPESKGGNSYQSNYAIAGSVWLMFKVKNDKKSNFYLGPGIDISTKYFEVKPIHSGDNRYSYTPVYLNALEIFNGKRKVHYLHYLQLGVMPISKTVTEDRSYYNGTTTTPLFIDHQYSGIFYVGVGAGIYSQIYKNVALQLTARLNGSYYSDKTHTSTGTSDNFNIVGNSGISFGVIF